jgi:uncharacterized protein
VKLDKCTALITGASAGIGQEFARQLARRAGALVLVARRQERLEQLRTELTARDPNLNVQIFRANLSVHEEVNALADWVDKQQIAVDLLINNAGLGDRGEFSTGDPRRIHEMLQVNIVALTTLTRRLLPRMIARKRGALLNVSSSASFLPMPRLAVYAATKAYVTSFSEALRTELRGTGIAVSALCPGPVHTEFDRVARRSGDAKALVAPSFTYVPVEDVVRIGLSAVERNQPIAIPGVAMKLAILFARLTPMPLIRLAGRLSPNP